MGQLKFGFVIADTTSSQVMVAEQTLRMLADVEGEEDDVNDENED